MNGGRKIIVGPEISPTGMAETWEQAIRDAADNPGMTITILFSPGTYPLPRHGAYVYKDKPTTIEVSSPGMEIDFTWEDGKIQMTTRNITTMKRRK